MKAAIISKYGSPEVIKIQDIEQPTINEEEVLIKVHAASINTLDTSKRAGTRVIFGLSRLSTGIRKPKDSSLGADVAGEIISIGSKITKFQSGDQVFGISRTGSCAEYAKGSERGIVKKPKNITYDEAAAVPVAGLTAVQYLRDLGKIKNGQTILIYGASGGVGTYAIQYAKLFDVEVTAVCSNRNFELVKNLGADQVIDYSKQDFTKLGKKYDIVFDTVGKSPQWRWKKALKDDGVFLQSGSPKMRFTRFFIQLFFNRFRKKKMKFTIAKTNSKDLEYLAQLLEEGKLKSIIDKSYKFENISQAHRYYDEGHTKGKVVVIGFE